MIYLLHEAKKSHTCYICNKPGHNAVSCHKEKIAFTSVTDCDADMQLLEPFMHDLVVLTGSHAR